jgi:ABC-type branched-subunit amino acid transport system substrate-binding protein
VAGCGSRKDEPAAKGPTGAATQPAEAGLDGGETTATEPAPSPEGTPSEAGAQPESQAPAPGNGPAANSSAAPAPAGKAAASSKPGQASANAPAPKQGAPAPGKPAPDAPSPVAPAPVPGASGGGGGAVKADQGVSDTEIKYARIDCMGAPYDTFCRSVGDAAAAAAFAENDKGGIQGRKLKLLTYAAGTDVERGKSLLKKAIEEDKVWGLDFLSYISGYSCDYLKSKGAFAISWGWFAQEFNCPNTYPYLLSQQNIGRHMMQTLGEKLKPKTAAILYLNDPGFLQGREEARKTAKELGIQVVAEVGAEPEQADLSGAVLQMRSANPDIIVGTVEPITWVKFIVSASNQGYRPKKGWGQAPITTTQLAQALGEWGYQTRVYANQYWTMYTKRSDPAIAEFWSDILKYFPRYSDPKEASRHTYYGQARFCATKTLINAAREAGPDLTWANVQKIMGSRRVPCMGGGIDWRFNNGTRLGPELVGLVHVGKLTGAAAQESKQPDGIYEWLVDDEKGGCYGKLTAYPYKHTC